MEAKDSHALPTSFGTHIVILLVMEVNYQLTATVVRMAHFIDVTMANYVLMEMRIKVFSCVHDIVGHYYDESVKKKLR